VNFQNKCVKGFTIFNLKNGVGESLKLQSMLGRYEIGMLIYRLVLVSMKQ